MTPPKTDQCATTSRALCGWSPADLPADNAVTPAVDRFVPRTGVPVIAFYLAVTGMLLVAGVLPVRSALALDGFAFLAGGAWCALNFWRCRHAHCVVTGAGWLGMSLFTLGEAVFGRSIIWGDEQLVFVAVLGIAVVFELIWSASRGTNSLAVRQQN